MENTLITLIASQRTRAVRISLVFLSLFFAHIHEVQATPLTYQFNMPNWDGSSNASLFGTNALLEITVDNGASSGLSQTYTFSNIQSLTVSAVGGSFSHTWTAASIIEDTGPQYAFLVTDATGGPTLDLLTHSTSERIYFRDHPITDVIFGVLSPTGGPVPFSIAVGNMIDFTDEAGVIGPIKCSDYCGFSVTGVALNATSVPEPSSLSLFGLALLGPGIARWRKKKANHSNKPE